jgi:hypothetical protein
VADQDEKIDYRECSTCGPPGHVGLTFVAEIKGFDPSHCNKCGQNTLALKDPPQEVIDDLRARAEHDANGQKLPDWYRKHCAVIGELPLPAFAKILSSPEAVQRIYLQYPPACVVRVKSTGEYGVNGALIGGDSEFPTIRVLAKPGEKHGTEHILSDLEVVGYWNGLTPDKVASVLDMKKPVTVEHKTKQIGRNEPCPCASGKKFKQCCGRLDNFGQNGAMQ